MIAHADRAARDEVKRSSQVADEAHQLHDRHTRSDYLRDKYIPGLIQVLFDRWRLEYNVAISRDSTPKSVFYSSDPTGANTFLANPMSSNPWGFRKALHF
jgi:hypothetical protein